MPLLKHAIPLVCFRKFESLDGNWDMKSCVVTELGKNFTKCLCSEPGHYALVAPMPKVEVNFDCKDYLNKHVLDGKRRTTRCFFIPTHHDLDRAFTKKTVDIDNQY